MSTESATSKSGRPSLLRNWLSLTGLVIGIGSLFSFFLLFMLDTLAHFSNPYIGILTYIIAPGFLIFGLALTGIGAWRERRKLGQASGDSLPRMVVDLSRPRDRKMMAGFIVGSLLFLLLTAMGSYHTYHFTESTQFCGQTCHTVMKPELVTYQHGPHARVSCVECHIGPGAQWFVKAKISGTYQLYATTFDKYPRPIKTPIHNLRPAQETCEQCHWPKKFVGNLDRTYNYFLGDETNTPFTVRLTMKVGGGDPTHGPEGGIHWHMNVKNNKVEYISAKQDNGAWIADEKRQNIPWVRIVDQQGVVTEFRTKGFTNDPASFAIRTMDCMDCHNRPAHMYKSPDKSVNLAMSLSRIDRPLIDRALPWIKTNALFALTRPYTNETQALQGIATILAERYPADQHPKEQGSVRMAIHTVQQIYRENFFPEMKASWDQYPDNIGHMIFPGCFRCHDGKHVTIDGKRSIKASDCTTCHEILAQGRGDDLKTLSAGGLKFAHPGDDLDENPTCNDCHNGGL